MNIQKTIEKYTTLAEKALSDLMFDYEIFGYTALSLGGIKVVDGSIHPALAWTDYKAIYINAEMAEEEGLNVEHIKFLIGHECLHVILLNSLRRENRDPELWNVATDCVINAMLIQEGKVCTNRSVGKFVDGGLYYPEFIDWSAEEIYDYISKNKDKIKQPQFQLDFHENIEDPNGSGELTNAAARAVVDQVMEILKAQQAKGNLSAQFERMLDKLPKVKENWKGILLKYIKSFDKSDSTWKRPNRRQLASGFYFPGTKRTERLNVAIGIDTSGSINDETLALFFGHLFSICQHFKKFTVKVFCWSTQVHEDTLLELNETNFRSFNVCDYKISSSGGTEAQYGIDYVNKWDDKPNCYICFTDGYIENDLENDNKNVPLVLAIDEGGNKDYEIPSTCKRTIKIIISK